MAVVLFLTGTGVAPETNKNNQDNWQKIKAGEIVLSDYVFNDPAGEKKVAFEVTALIKATQEQVWSTVRDYDHFAEFMPRVKSCKAEKWDGGCAIVRYDTEILWATLTYYINACATGSNRQVDFSLAQGHKSQIKATEGFWKLEPAPEGSGTILSYSAYIDTGVSLADFIAARASRQSLPEVLSNVRKRAESGGKWKK